MRQMTALALGVLLVLGIVIVNVENSIITAQIDQNSSRANQKIEFEAVQKKVKEAAAKTDPGLWQEATKGFDAWIKKYNVKVEPYTAEPVSQTGQAAQSGTGAPKSKCKREMLHPTGPFWCVLDDDRSTATKCVYKCTRI